MYVCMYVCMYAIQEKVADSATSDMFCIIGDVKHGLAEVFEIYYCRMKYLMEHFINIHKYLMMS